MKANQQNNGLSRRILLIFGGACLLAAVVALVAGLTRSRPSLEDATAPQVPVMERTESGTAGSAANEVRPPAAEQPKPLPEFVRAADSPLRDIAISYKLDPRLTKGLYMGERWVSPPAYTRVSEGSECVIEVKVQGEDVQGKAVDINPQWTSGDPGLVFASDGEGKAVTLTVVRPGQTTIEVGTPGVSKKLALTAVADGDALVVEIAQPEVKKDLLAAQAAPSYKSPEVQTAQPRAQVPKPDRGVRPHHRVRNRAQPTTVPSESTTEPETSQSQTATESSLTTFEAGEGS